MEGEFGDSWASKLRHLTAIHVLGAGLKTERPANRLFHDIGELGWRLVPVHPRDAGNALLGRPVRAELAQSSAPELVVFFLSPKASMSALLQLIRTTPRSGMPLLWFQPGAVDDGLMEVLEGSGYGFVTETCIVRFIQGRELTPREPSPVGAWYKQVLSAKTNCSMWTVHQPEGPSEPPSPDALEWCGDLHDLEYSNHIVPRYIRSLGRPGETLTELGKRLAKDVTSA